MSSISAPFGLRPSFHGGGGLIRPVAGTIASGYNTNIFMGSPVGYIADGSIAMAAAGGTGVAGACGAFAGVEYTPADGRRRVGNTWPANQVATDIVAYFTVDPMITYDIQCSGTLTQAAIGGQFDWSTNGSANGNTTTGISTVALNIGSGAANAGLRVVGLTPGPDNAWGDAFPVVQVQLSEHQFVAPVAQI